MQQARSCWVMRFQICGSRIINSVPRRGLPWRTSDYWPASILAAGIHIHFGSQKETRNGEHCLSLRNHRRSTLEINPRQSRPDGATAGYSCRLRCYCEAITRAVRLAHGNKLVELVETLECPLKRSVAEVNLFLNNVPISSLDCYHI